MKTILAVALLSVPAFAQPLSSNPLNAACGNATSSYAVSAGPTHSSVAADPEMATVVLITRSYIVHYGCGQTVRFGMDSKWLGALCLDQHVVAQIQPGDHHLCVDLQNQKGAPAFTALSSLHAEAGKVYYFRAYYGVNHSLLLHVLDGDEGSLLLGTTKSAVSKLK